MNFLVTGGAGFIVSHVCERLGVSALALKSTNGILPV